MVVPAYEVKPKAIIFNPAEVQTFGPLVRSQLLSSAAWRVADYLGEGQVSEEGEGRERERETEKISKVKI